MNGRFLVGKVIGKPGGFGITYLGYDKLEDCKVAIKEFLPRDISGRDSDQLTVVAHSHEDQDTFAQGIKSFLQEARTLALMNHTNVVRIRDFFEANSTAYIVMDYYDGLTLSEYLSSQPSKKMPENLAINCLIPVLDGLREVHGKGFLHRDIKPQNIYLTSDNRLILLDFGAARQSVGDRSKSLSVVLSEGYAPIEQYQRNGKQGPWTDIYGAAATLYEMVSGSKPPSAMDRLAGENITPPNGVTWSKSLLDALTVGMMVDPDHRCRSVGEWQRILLNQHPNKVITAPAISESRKDRKELSSNPKSNKEKKFSFIKLFSILFGLLIFSWTLILNNNYKSEMQRESFIAKKEAINTTKPNDIQPYLELGGELCKEIAEKGRWIDTNQQVTDRHIQEFGASETRSISLHKQLELDKAALTLAVIKYTEKISKSLESITKNQIDSTATQISSAGTYNDQLFDPYTKLYLGQLIRFSNGSGPTPNELLAECKSIKSK